MLSSVGKTKNGYTTSYTRKLLLQLITHIYPTGHNKPFEECYLFGSLIRGGRYL